MSEREKEVAASLVQALEVLPEHKKEFLAGYAEGVNVAMSAVRDQDKEAPEAV